MNFIARVKTEKYHNNQEGDCGKAINNYYKKKFWKRYDRKRYIVGFFKSLNRNNKL